MTTIIGTIPFIFVPGTVIFSGEVNTDFDFIRTQVNANAAGSGANSDITSLSALTSFTSTSGVITGNLSVGTLNVSGVATFADDIVMTGTGGLTLAAGNTSQRDPSPNLGEIRYNTTLGGFEGYGGIPPAWGPLAAGQNGTPFSRGLTITNIDTVDPATVINVNAIELRLTNSTGFIAYGTSISFDISTTFVGAGGLDTGTIQPDTFYSIWAISNGVTFSGVLSLSPSSPVLPPGYIYLNRVGTTYTDGLGNLSNLMQRGNRIEQLVTSIGYPLIYSTTTTGTIFPANASGFFPVTANRIIVKLQLNYNPTSETNSAELYADYNVSSDSPLLVITTTENALASVAAATATINITTGVLGVALAGTPAGTLSLYCVGWEEPVAVF